MVPYLDFLQAYKPPADTYGGNVFGNLEALLTGLEKVGYRVQISAYRCICPVVTLHALPVLDMVEISAIDTLGHAYLLIVSYASSVINFDSDNRDALIVMHRATGADKSARVNDIINNLSDYAYRL